MYTYFVSNGSSVKIGRTDNVPARLRTLQTSSSKKLQVLLVLDRDCEKELHQAFAGFRTSGEWFAFSKDFHDFFHRQPTEDPVESARILREAQSLYSLPRQWETEDLLCPFCGRSYQHIRSAPLPYELEKFTGFRVLMDGECGHRWSLLIGERKGETSIFAANAMPEDFSA